MAARSRQNRTMTGFFNVSDYWIPNLCLAFSRSCWNPCNAACVSALRRPTDVDRDGARLLPSRIAGQPPRPTIRTIPAAGLSRARGATVAGAAAGAEADDCRGLDCGPGNKKMYDCVGHRAGSADLRFNFAAAETEPRPREPSHHVLPAN